MNCAIGIIEFADHEGIRIIIGRAALILDSIREIEDIDCEVS